MGVAEDAVALRAEAVGDTEIGEDVENVEGPLQGAGMDLADADGEAVAGQVTGAQLVAMAAGGEDTHPRDVQRQGLLRAHAGDGDGLPGGGPGILEPGVAELPLPHSQRPGQLLEEVEGGQAGLLDLQVEVFPLAAGRVEGDLLDPEILGADLDPAAGAGEAFGEEDDQPLPAQLQRTRKPAATGGSSAGSACQARSRRAWTKWIGCPRSRNRRMYLERG